jgi:hypothetical protein
MACRSTREGLSLSPATRAGPHRHPLIWTPAPAGPRPPTPSALFRTPLKGSPAPPSVFPRTWKKGSATPADPRRHAIRSTAPSSQILRDPLPDLHPHPRRSDVALLQIPARRYAISPAQTEPPSPTPNPRARERARRVGGGIWEGGGGGITAGAAKGHLRARRRMSQGAQPISSPFSESGYSL